MTPLPFVDRGYLVQYASKYPWSNTMTQRGHFMSCLQNNWNSDMGFRFWPNGNSRVIEVDETYLLIMLKMRFYRRDPLPKLRHNDIPVCANQAHAMTNRQLELIAVPDEKPEPIEEPHFAKLHPLYIGWYPEADTTYKIVHLLDQVGTMVLHRHQLDLAQVAMQDAPNDPDAVKVKMKARKRPTGTDKENTG